MGARRRAAIKGLRLHLGRRARSEKSQHRRRLRTSIIRGQRQSRMASKLLRAMSTRSQTGPKAPDGVIGMQGNVSGGTSSWTPAKQFPIPQRRELPHARSSRSAKRSPRVPPEKYEEWTGFRTINRQPDCEVAIARAPFEVLVASVSATPLWYALGGWVKPSGHAASRPTQGTSKAAWR